MKLLVENIGKTLSDINCIHVFSSQSLKAGEIKAKTFFVVQGLRICLAMQGMKVLSLVRELRSHMLWGN